MNEYDEDDQDPKKAALKQMMQIQPGAYDPTATTKVFPDTGRTANNPGEVLDSYLGAPARTAVSEMQQGNFSGALGKAWNQAGQDPQKSVTGTQLAQQAGLSNEPLPYIGASPAAIGGAGLGMATDPMMYTGAGEGEMLGGVAGRIQSVAPQVAEEAAPAFNNLKRMFQAGEVQFPASNTAEALKIKRALEDSGKLAPNRALIDLERK